jgi:hypothetical protein
MKTNSIKRPAKIKRGVVMSVINIIAFMFNIFASSVSADDPMNNLPSKLVGTTYTSIPNDWDDSWGTPLYGIYSRSDTNAMNYHIQIIRDAGIDFVTVDFSNNTPHHPKTLHFLFRTGSSYSVQQEYPWVFWYNEDLYAVADDFNGDGMDDVGHWSATTGYWRFLLAPNFEHDKGWANYQGWTSAKGVEYQPFTDDFNRDGYTDIGLRNSTTGEWFVRQSTGPGTWSAAESLIAVKASGDIYQPYTGDFNGDGYADIGMRNPVTGRFFFWPGPTYNSTQETFDWEIGSNFTAFCGDFNGDGFSDIGLRNSNDGEIHFKLGPSFDITNTVTWEDAVGTYWTPLSADWDQDGKDDIGLHNRSLYRADIKTVEDNGLLFIDTLATIPDAPAIVLMPGIRDADNLSDGRFQAKINWLYETIVENPDYSDTIQYYEGKPLLLVWTRYPTVFPGGVPEWDDTRFTVRFGTAYIDAPWNGDLTVSDPRNSVAQDGNMKPQALYGHWSWEQRSVRAYSVDEYNNPEMMTVQTAFREGQGLDAQSNSGGAFFKETWEHAHNVDPRIVLVPTFNEWTTLEHPSADIARDIEPSVEFGTLFMDILEEEIEKFKQHRSDLIIRDSISGYWSIFNSPDFWYQDKILWAAGGRYKGIAGNFIGNGWGSIGLRDALTGAFFIRSAKDASENSQILIDWPSRSGTTYQPFIGDFNEDGYTDIGLRDSTTGEWFVRQSTGPGTWSATESLRAVKASGDIYQPYTGDFNGDGYTDIGMRNPVTGRFFFWPGPTYNSTQETFDWESGLNFTAFCGDFNGDGFDDVGLRDSNNGRIDIRHSTASSTINFGQTISFDGPVGDNYQVVMTTDIR